MYKRQPSDRVSYHPYPNNAGSCVRQMFRRGGCNIPKMLGLLLSLIHILEVMTDHQMLSDKLEVKVLEGKQLVAVGSSVNGIPCLLYTSKWRRCIW